ncbi:TolC family protein [Algoriphagus antarcticus]|uniref:Outer membrane protein TolC n=1 Tax=Algoriphagus antarcticus TaxID=238540 RepID=A0A3E0DSK8_9BACT|nr:TolC family protein [Algoriphagus antarcticus]REG86396.1 outer membrane protein TolC [Algoriphagus antarcticus]
MKTSNLNVLLLSLLLFIANPFLANSQTLTLEQCQDLARQNYPLINQLELINLSRDFSVENAGKRNLPQINLGGQATYQSDVTGFPIDIPNLEIQPIAKDQYKLFAEVSQPLTSTSGVKTQKQLAEANAMTQAQQLQVELYQLKGRVNQVYFGVLLLDKQLQQNEIRQNDIQAGISQTKAAIENGTALQSSLDILQAELLNADQQRIELAANQQGFTQMLGLLIGQEISSAVSLQIPILPALSQEINRPELGLFASQKGSILLQQELISSKNIPQLNLFFQGGYGRPALNFLSNDFDLYYLGGLRFNWNISRYYTSSREKELLNLNLVAIVLQEETFRLNTKIALTQQETEIAKYLKLMQTDKEIITLRERVQASASSQLEYGTITSNDFLTYINAADQARQNLALHQIQLLLAQSNYQITSGN